MKLDRMSGWIGLALVLAIGASACKGAKEEQADNARKLTAESTHDATEPIVDNDYRFELRWPGEGWKLMGEVDVSQITPGALAGATNLEGAAVVVIVEEAPGATLDGMADLIAAGVPGENVEVIDRAMTKLDGKDAYRLVIDTTISDTRFRHVNAGVLHQGHLFQVHGWGQAAIAPEPMIDAAARSFHILDGEIVGRVSKHVVADSAGVGWTVEGGVYRNALSGIAIDPPDGWRVVVGSELAMMNAEADVGIVSDRPEAYIAVLTEAAPPGQSEAFVNHLREQFVAALVTTGEPETLERPVGGAPLQVWRYQSDGLEYLHGARVNGDRAVQVLGWYYAGLRERTDKPVADAFASISFLDDAARAALRADLIDRPSPQFDIGVGWSVRGSVFRDFTHAVKWTAPKGSFWTLAGGEAARTIDAGAVLALEEKERGAVGVLITGELDGADAATWHSGIEEHWGWPVSERGVAKLSDGREGPMSVATGELAGAAFEWVIITTVGPRLGVALVLWGPAPLRKRLPRLVQDAAGGLELLDDLPEITNVGRYVDHRFGLSFVPPKGFELRDETQDRSSLGRSVMLKKGNTVLAVHSVFAPSQGSGDWMESFLEQALRDRFSELMASGAPERSATEVAGRPARKLAWSKPFERLDAVVFSRGPRVFAVTLSNADQELAKAFLDSFELPD